MECLVSISLGFENEIGGLCPGFADQLDKEGGILVAAAGLECLEDCVIAGL